MPTHGRIIRDNDDEFVRYFVNDRGVLLDSMRIENTKWWAVAVKCGHVGKGYYVPILFPAKCATAQDAIKCVLNTPKVKRDCSSVVLTVFEITPFEKFILRCMNDKDLYIKGVLTEDDEEIRQRRLPMDLSNRYNVPRKHRIREDYYIDFNTRDKIPERYALERFFAPYYMGDKLIYPKNVNSKELLKEMFKQAAINYGFKNNFGFFPALYYQRYGKNNDLGISLEDGVLSYEYNGEQVQIGLTKKMTEMASAKFEELWGDKEIAGNLPTLNDDLDLNGVQLPSSQIDKFNARMAKYKRFNSDLASQGSQPGEE